jgi:hypothetical protein
MKDLLPGLAIIACLSAALADTPAPSPAPFKPVTSRSVAVTRSPEQPEYARSLKEATAAYGLETLKSDVEWLEVGIESRTRYEYRWHDYTTASLITDDILVTRNFLYIGVKHVIDPLRFVFELDDSRAFVSDRPDTPNAANEFEPMQAYVQLHFDNVFGHAPLSLSVGRMTIDSIDRRLIERTRNRNTMTTFDGVRLRLGDDQSPWEIDTFALRHAEREIEDFDESTPNSTLYGLTAYFRGMSPHLVIEPYWLWLDERDEPELAARRNLQTYGVHAFGQWGEHCAWDYDVDLVGQFGESRGLDHRAGAAHVEAGYTWSTGWKPRLALWFNYATGDRHPNDGSDERFDSLFGDNFSFYSYAGYLTWQNMINPALRLSFHPTSRLKCELIHRVIWLASDTDAWVRAGRRDPSGDSGSYVGQEADARTIWTLCSSCNIDIAYAHFIPGDFTDHTGASPDSNFVQIAATITF